MLGVLFARPVFAASAGTGDGPDAPVRSALPTGIEIRANLAYYEGQDADPVRHRADVYLPKRGSPGPVLIFFHGGGWSFGRKDSYRALGEGFAAQGFAVVIPNYRLSPAVKHPEHVRDAARAVAWTLARAATWGADPARVVVSGHSAGGHLAALLALDPRYLRAQGLAPRSLAGVIGISGPYHLGFAGFEDAFGKDRQARRDASPGSHVEDQPAAAVPPFLLLHAERDPRWLSLSARTLRRALAAHGVQVDEQSIPDRTHVSIAARLPEANDPAGKRVAAFVRAVPAVRSQSR